jgi:hypothetical protein
MVARFFFSLKLDFVSARQGTGNQNDFFELKTVRDQNLQRARASGTIVENSNNVQQKDLS